MGILNFIKNLLFGTWRVSDRLVITDPERLHQRPTDKAYSKSYSRYKKTYYYGQSGGTELIEAQRKLAKRGKRVKCWKLVLSHSDFSMDQYIPIFYGNKRNHSKSRNKKRRKH
jgi:hypothetical protein